MKVIPLYIGVLSFVPNFKPVQIQLRATFLYQEKHENAEANLSVMGFYWFSEIG